MRERRVDWQTGALGGFAGAVTLLALLVAAWLHGGVSRARVRVQSPDGRIEAICRGRLPESTEYDLWLRRRWQPWGSYAAASGSESMSRCRDIVWSPDGSFVLVVNEGNTIVVVEAGTRRRLEVHGRFAPGERWDYASARIITSLRFTSGEEVAFEHCDRLRVARGVGGDFSRCGQDARHGRARLTRSGSRMSFTIIPNG